jgi:hypothetical protein
LTPLLVVWGAVCLVYISEEPLPLPGHASSVELIDRDGKATTTDDVDLEQGGEFTHVHAPSSVEKFKWSQINGRICDDTTTFPQSTVDIFPQLRSPPENFSLSRVDVRICDHANTFPNHISQLLQARWSVQSHEGHKHLASVPPLHHQHRLLQRHLRFLLCLYFQV